MPFSYRLEVERHLIEVVFTGLVTETDLTQARESVITDPAYEKSFGLLVDIQAADLSVLNPSALRERASRLPIAGRIAILASSSFGYGMARMYELASLSHVAVFRSRNEAVGWLSLSSGV
jgi:hypothetical protein